MWLPPELWSIIMVFLLPKDPPWKRQFHKTVAQLKESKVIRRRPTIIHSTNGILCIIFDLKVNNIGCWRGQMEHFYLN